MKVLAESNSYQILNEYESVLLRVKETSQLINIGDFYGDPQVALISNDEKYCVMGGDGVIIYYLTDPFEIYRYHAQSAQWKEWGRGDENNTIWVNNIIALDNNRIEIETEDLKKTILDVY
jgi:hypothetical protein